MAKNTALRRLNKIAKTHGLVELANEHAKYFGIDTGIACEFAPCVCAAAFDKFRTAPETAYAICDEVWADSSLAVEAGFHAAREQTLSFMEAVGAHPVVRFENKHAQDVKDVVCVLECPNCRTVFRINYNQAATTFRHRCPLCKFS